MMQECHWLAKELKTLGLKNQAWSWEHTRKEWVWHLDSQSEESSNRLHHWCTMLRTRRVVRCWPDGSSLRFWRHGSVRNQCLNLVRIGVRAEARGCAYWWGPCWQFQLTVTCFRPFGRAIFRLLGRHTSIWGFKALSRSRELWPWLWGVLKNVAWSTGTWGCWIS